MCLTFYHSLDYPFHFHVTKKSLFPLGSALHLHILCSLCVSVRVYWLSIGLPVRTAPCFFFFFFFFFGPSYFTFYVQTLWGLWQQDLRYKSSFYIWHVHVNTKSSLGCQRSPLIVFFFLSFFCIVLATTYIWYQFADLWGSLLSSGFLLLCSHSASLSVALPLF